MEITEDRRSMGMATSGAKRATGRAVLALSMLGLLGGCVAAPPATEPGYSYVCHAGVYQCTLPAQYRLGTRCSCPALGAPSFGRVG